MNRVVLAAILLLATACPSTTPSGTDDTSTPDGESPAFALDSFEMSECLDTKRARTVTPVALEATCTAPGTVEVLHHLLDINCCATLTPVATLGEAIIEVSYTVGGDKCWCECPFDMSYTLVGIPAGTWLIEAAGDQVSVEVL